MDDAKTGRPEPRMVHPNNLALLRSSLARQHQEKGSAMDAVADVLGGAFDRLVWLEWNKEEMGEHLRRLVQAMDKSSDAHVATQKQLHVANERIKGLIGEIGRLGQTIAHLERNRDTAPAPSDTVHVVVRNQRDEIERLKYDLSATQSALKSSDVERQRYHTDYHNEKLRSKAAHDMLDRIDLIADRGNGWQGYQAFPLPRKVQAWVRAAENFSSVADNGSDKIQTLNDQIARFRALFEKERDTVSFIERVLSGERFVHLPPLVAKVSDLLAERDRCETALKHEKSQYKALADNIGFGANDVQRERQRYNAVIAGLRSDLRGYSESLDERIGQVMASERAMCSKIALCSTDADLNNYPTQESRPSYICRVLKRRLLSLQRSYAAEQEHRSRLESSVLKVIDRKVEPHKPRS